MTVRGSSPRLDFDARLVSIRLAGLVVNVTCFDVRVGEGARIWVCQATVSPGNQDS